MSAPDSGPEEMGPLRAPPPGGKPPMKCQPFDVFERAPTHDGIPCISAWQDHIAFKSHPDYRDSPGRPIWSVQVYDTSPVAGSALHIEQLARRLFAQTYEDALGGLASEDSSRLDVYGLAMPAGATPEERATRCIAQNTAEALARGATGTSDFYVPRTFRPKWYQRGIFILDGSNWDERRGEVLQVWWDIDEAARHRKRSGEEYVLPEVQVEEDRGANLTYLIWELNERVRWFNSCYVPEGMLDDDVMRAKRAYAEGVVSTVDRSTS